MAAKLQRVPDPVTDAREYEKSRAHSTFSRCVLHFGAPIFPDSGAQYLAFFGRLAGPHAGPAALLAFFGPPEALVFNTRLACYADFGLF